MDISTGNIYEFFGYVDTYRLNFLKFRGDKTWFSSEFHNNTQDEKNRKPLYALWGFIINMKEALEGK